MADVLSRERASGGLFWHGRLLLNMFFLTRAILYEDKLLCGEGFCKKKN